MKRSGEIGPFDDIHCIECGDMIKPDDDYHTIRRSRYSGGAYIHIHKSCYEAPLPKNKSKKEVIL